MHQLEASICLGLGQQLMNGSQSPGTIGSLHRELGLSI